MAATEKFTIDDQETIEILEDIARRSTSVSARLQALKELREMRAGEPDGKTGTGFDELYGDDLAAARSKRAAA